jgi:hypothetical protein
MNLLEAARQGITRIRKTDWAPGTFLKLIIINGQLSVFAELYEPHPQKGNDDCPYLHKVKVECIGRLRFGLDFGEYDLSDKFQGELWEACPD